MIPDSVYPVALGLLLCGCTAVRPVSRSPLGWAILVRQTDTETEIAVGSAPYHAPICLLTIPASAPIQAGEEVFTVNWSDGSSTVQWPSAPHGYYYKSAVIPVPAAARSSDDTPKR
ncbi:MAG: hypothetical protein KGS61_04400 [Verrucomicrobia bacterium]|nr:hypothetical protein [Verrucomicrobiota bacterium]